MVQLGLNLEGVGTALDLEEGLVYLNAKAKRSGVVARTGSAPAPVSSPKAPLDDVQTKRGGGRR